MKFRKGQRVEIETVDGWLPGKFEGYVVSTNPDEEAPRLIVRGERGQLWRGAHPRCVRKPVLASAGKEGKA